MAKIAGIHDVEIDRRSQAPTGLLRWREWVPVAAVAVIGCLLFTFGALSLLAEPDGQQRAYKRSLAYQLLVKQGNSLVEGVARTTEPALARGRSIASNPGLKSMLATGGADALTDFCNRQITHATEIDVIVIFDATGRPIAMNTVYADGRQIPPDRIALIMEADFTAREVVRGCLNNTTDQELLEYQMECDITPAIFGSVGLAVAHSVPVYDESGAQLGVVSTRMRFERLGNLLGSEQESDSGLRGHFVGENGRFFDEAMHRDDDWPVPPETIALMMESFRASDTPYVVFESDGNFHALFRTLPLSTIEGGGIFVVASLPKAAMLKEARQAGIIRGLVWLAFGALFLFAGIVGILWMRVRRSAGLIAATERRQAAVLQAIPDLLFVLDRDGIFLEYRGGDRSLLLSDPEHFLGKRYEQVLPPELAANLRAAINRACSSGEPIVLDYVLDVGTPRWFEARIACMGDGRAIVLSRDITDRRRFLEQAQELHGLRMAINEHTLFSIADARGRIIEINDGFCRISGYSQEELLGQDHRILNSGYHPKAFWIDMWKTIASGKPWRGEVCNRAKDGSLYWVDSTNIPLAGQSGKIERYISLRFDITERKRLEAENAKSMARYSALFNGCRDAVCILDESGFIDCNPAALQLFGVESLAAFIGRHPTEFSPEVQADGTPSPIAAQVHIERAFREGADRFEWIHLRADTGEAFQAEVLLSAHPIDGRMVLQAVVRDITERVEARERLASIYEALSEGIVLMDQEGRIIECNPAAEEVLGIPHDQIVGRTPRDQRWRAVREDGTDLPPEDAPAICALRTGQSVQRFVHGIVRPDGETRWLSVSCEPIRESDGTPRGVVASIADITVQHEQSRRIAAQQEELNQFFSSSLDMLCIASVDGRFLRLNPEWKVCLGYSVEELQGAEFLSFVHPEDIPSTLAAVKQLRECESISRFENRYRCRDGTYRWIEWRSTRIGELIYASARDVTDRRRNERLIDEQRRELQGIIDAIPGYVYYKDASNKILDLNKAAAESIGLPKDLIRGRLTEEFFPPDDAKKYLEDDRAVLASGDPKIGIIESYATGGQLRHIRTDKIPLRGIDGHFDRLVAIATDITEIVDSRERANLAQHRLNLALQASNTGLWEWNIQTGETLFSETWYTMLGYEPGELPMCIDTWTSLCHPDDMHIAERALRRHLSGESSVYNCDHRLKCKDGSWLWVRDVGEVIERDETGAPLKAVGVHLDIQQLRESVIRAEAASQAKSDFLANMSHEIRTPMTAILGYADLIMDPTSCADEIESHVRTIQSNAGHLLTIINDILDMSKIEAGQMTVEHIHTDPVQIVEEVASLMRPRAIGKGISLAVSYDTHIPLTIRSDPTRLRQILLNLVGNAIKFTEIGSVTIHAACDPHAANMTFRVIDTGIGMTDDERAVIARFDAFTQADTGTTRKFGGTGLGLRISNSLARVLGGGITLESSLGHGSTFTVTIETGPLGGVELRTPAELSDIVAEERAEPMNGSAAHEQSWPSGSKPLTGLRIMVAEDGPDNQRLIRFHLKKAGATVILADNGLIATQIIEAATPETMPHLVLMDMQMPELDGYDATRHLRQRGCRLPIIALTAHAMESDRRKCLNAGCDDYLTKPIDRTRLVQTCAAWASDPSRRVA